MADHYADGTYCWWHLSDPSPELLGAVADGWLPAPGRALDVGCGLGTEAAYLHRAGWQVVGVDLSRVAVTTAASRNPGPGYLQTNVLNLPLRSLAFDAAVDRGCFHYLRPCDRARYAAELGRVLRPGGRLLLRASLRAAGVRNDLSEEVLRSAFAGWQVDQLSPAEILSDTRTLDVLLARLRVPSASG